MDPMDVVRFGRGIRALRRRRGWRQLDLGGRSGVSRNAVSRIELGQGDRVTIRTLDAIAAALGARIDVRLSWNGEALDRLLDAAHADLVERIARLLDRAGWEIDARGVVQRGWRAWLDRSARSPPADWLHPGRRGQERRTGRPGDDRGARPEGTPCTNRGARPRLAVDERGAPARDRRGPDCTSPGRCVRGDVPTSLPGPWHGCGHVASLAGSGRAHVRAAIPVTFTPGGHSSPDSGAWAIQRRRRSLNRSQVHA